MAKRNQASAGAIAAAAAAPTDTTSATSTDQEAPSALPAADVAAAAVTQSGEQAPASDDVTAAGAGEAQAEIPSLFIRSVSEQGFRRAGFAFTREGVGIALDALSEEQIAALRAEPNLVVEETTFLADEAAD